MIKVKYSRFKTGNFLIYSRGGKNLLNSIQTENTTKRALFILFVCFVCLFGFFNLKVKYCYKVTSTPEVTF